MLVFSVAHNFTEGFELDHRKKKKRNLKKKISNKHLCFKGGKSLQCFILRITLILMLIVPLMLAFYSEKNMDCFARVLLTHTQYYMKIFNTRVM